MIEAWRDEPKRRFPCLPQRERRRDRWMWLRMNNVVGVCEEGFVGVRGLSGERREEGQKGKFRVWRNRLDLIHENGEEKFECQAQRKLAF